VESSGVKADTGEVWYLVVGLESGMYVRLQYVVRGMWIGRSDLLVEVRRVKEEIFGISEKSLMGGYYHASTAGLEDRRVRFYIIRSMSASLRSLPTRVPPRTLPGRRVRHASRGSGRNSTIAYRPRRSCEVRAPVYPCGSWTLFTFFSITHGRIRRTGS